MKKKEVRYLWSCLDERPFLIVGQAYGGLPFTRCAGRVKFLFYGTGARLEDRRKFLLLLWPKRSSSVNKFYTVNLNNLRHPGPSQL